MNLFNPIVRQSIETRIDALTPDREPVWGTMTCGRMVTHVSDQLRLAVGDLRVTDPKPGPLRHFPLKYFVLYIAPWPKAKIQAPVEAFSTDPVAWERDVSTLKELITRVCERQTAKTWPVHPIFGKMTAALTGKLSGRHLDHHLRQFGV